MSLEIETKTPTVSVDGQIGEEDNINRLRRMEIGDVQNTGFVQDFSQEKIPPIALKRNQESLDRLSKEDQKRWQDLKEGADQSMERIRELLGENFPIFDILLSEDAQVFKKTDKSVKVIQKKEKSVINSQKSGKRLVKGRSTIGNEKGEHYIVFNPQALQSTDSNERLMAIVNHERFHSVSFSQRILSPEDNEGDYIETKVSGLQLKNPEVDTQKISLSKKDLENIIKRLREGDNAQMNLLTDKQKEYMLRKLDTYGSRSKEKARSQLMAYLNTLKATALASGMEVEDVLPVNDAMFSFKLDEGMTDFFGVLSVCLQDIEPKKGPGENSYGLGGKYFFEDSLMAELLSKSSYSKYSLQILDLCVAMDDTERMDFVKRMFEAKKNADPAIILNFFKDRFDVKLTVEELFLVNFDKVFEAIENKKQIKSEDEKSLKEIRENLKKTILKG
jgi:hypothetical protein